METRLCDYAAPERKGEACFRVSFLNARPSDCTSGRTKWPRGGSFTAPPCLSILRNGAPSPSHSILHLAVKPVKWAAAVLPGRTVSLSHGAHELQKNRREPERVSGGDPLSFLPVNLQCDSGCSRGHLSTRSSLRAISATMSSTTKLCMEAWLRTVSITYYTKMATTARGRLDVQQGFGPCWGVVVRIRFGGGGVQHRPGGNA